jgi:hypothetical protein
MGTSKPDAAPPTFLPTQPSFKSIQFIAALLADAHEFVSAQASRMKQ